MTEKNLAYRGLKSWTLRLVLLGYFTGTYIFIMTDKLTGSEWVTGVLGLLATYVLKESAAKASEAYRDKPVEPGG